MKKIIVLSGSIRHGRQTHRIAEYISNYINENVLAKSFLVDLKAYNFSLFEERFKFTENPSENELKYRNLINDADGIIIVSPEYNLGIPASVKNSIDFLSEEWENKKVAMAMVSSGSFGGRTAWTELVKTMVHLKAIPSSTGLFFPMVQNNFGENGELLNKVKFDKKVKNFIENLMKMI